MGTRNRARKSMAAAWPSRDRLKQPRRSPDRESAPHDDDRARLEDVHDVVMTGSNTKRYDSSSMPSCRGTLTE